jgi:hypothetical protein
VRMVRKVSDQREQGCMVSEDLFNASVQQAFRGELTSDGGK